MATKERPYPKQFRLTLKDQIERVYDETDKTFKTFTLIKHPALAFANIYEPHTKAYPARVTTQDNWAYQEDVWNVDKTPAFFVKDGVYWSRIVTNQLKKGLPESARYDRNLDNFEIVVKEGPMPDELQPRIIDNVVLEGFRIQHLVARHRGNKLWRILDPRGFELEIGSGCFEDLVMTGAVDKGLIIGPCIWKTGKMLVRV